MTFEEMGKMDGKTLMLLPGTSGMFMNKFEATWMGLGGSTILMGRK